MMLRAAEGACLAGSFLASPSQCVPCSAGTYSTKADATECTECSPGSYQPVPLSQGCIQCQAGKYQSLPRATTCLDCPADQSTLDPTTWLIIQGQVSCRSCPPGRWLTSSGCAACPPDSFCNALGVHACTQPLPGLQYVRPSESCTPLTDAVVRPCTECQPAGAYAVQACTPTADSVCRQCAACRPMLEYQAMPCNETHNTLCVACNREAGDMDVGGACNPCPAGAWGSDCSLCPPHTFSAEPNTQACTPCPAGLTSAAGASRCVLQCAQGYSPDGEGACVPLAQPQSLEEAWDPSIAQIQAAAPTATLGRFLVAKGTTTISQLFIMAAGSSWLLAGGLKLPSSDGVGQAAAFQTVGDMAWDPEHDIYLVIEVAGAARRVTAQGEVSTPSLPATAAWCAVAYFGGRFVLGSSRGIYAMGGEGWLRSTGVVMPLSVQGGLVLDQGVLIAQQPWHIVCGGGAEVLQGVLGEALPCDGISLGASGAIDYLSDYVLFFNSEWCGVGQISSSTGMVTILWLAPPGTVPLRLLGATPEQDALFLATRSPASILRIGLHGCLCQRGLFCWDGQCVDPPLGTVAPQPWASAPTPCPQGSVASSGAHEECALCPQNYTTREAGAWYCQPSCPAGLFLMAGACLPGCNRSEGLYHDLRLGQCLPCWLGSGATGGRGVDSCFPCPAGQFGAAPGICARCLPGTTTLSPGAARCMPERFQLCADGGLTCPPSANAPSILRNDSAAGALVVWPNGSLVLDARENVLVAQADSSLFSTVVGSRALWREAETWAVLPQPIHGLAAMEVPGHVSVLYVSSMLALEEGGLPCAEVYAVSTFDRGLITHFMSQDLLKSPAVALSQCVLQPIVLAGSSEGMLYAAVGPHVYAARVVGAGAYPQSLFMQDPILQVDQGTVTFLATANLNLFVGTSTGHIHSIPPSAATLQGYQSLVVHAGEEGLRGLGAAGRRVFFLDATGALGEVLFSNVRGCMVGYEPTQLNTAWAGICMQSGRGAGCPPGTYGPQPGALKCLPCPEGTIASVQGSAVCSQCAEGLFSSSDHTECLAQCPSGALQGGCRECAPGYYPDAASNACEPCPAGTRSSAEGCVQCPEGYTSPPGAHTCVRICNQDADSCAYDGEQCISLTRDYHVLSQIVMRGQILALAADSVGGVFFSDGTRIQYYQDDCSSYDTQCTKQGGDLLPPALYTGYRFAALSICNRVQTSSQQCASGLSRTLYVGSLIKSSLYAVEVCQDALGRVMADGTGQLRLVAGRGWAGFMDGPAMGTALFNQPVDLEINSACTLLYVSDFANHRIRLLNLSSGWVSTVAGSGQGCWKEGSTAPCANPALGCDPSTSECASLQYPLGIGLSPDETSLYIAGNAVHSLFRLSGGQLTSICGFTYSNMAYGVRQECNLNLPGSKGCMLYRPFDAVALDDQDVFVGVTQGLTRIDVVGGQCEQVAGQFFDLQTTGFRDGVMPLSDSDYSTSLVNMPFKIAVSKGTRVLYFADLMNAAVRRVLVGTACVCPVGSFLLPSAASCYNPLPPRALAPLPACTQPGRYALQGDTDCTRSCADALAQGLMPLQCSSSASVRQTLSYAQLLGPVWRPQNALPADWYGQGPSLDWDAIFDSASAYQQGAMQGHAPSSNGDFVSLTFSQGCWAVEQRYALQPRLILPGLWYACGEPILAASARGCACPGHLFVLERSPITPGRWQALREAAVQGQAEGITQSSVMVLLGTDQSAPSTCAGRAEGPCFPAWQVSSDGSDVWLDNRPFQASWVGDGVLNVQCLVGWPAHYYCPNGYIWTLPADQQQLCASPVLPALATCLSCLPGTYSAEGLAKRQAAGGPYRCEPCLLGFFASSVGSTRCLECPANTYGSAPGSSVCTACAPGKYTALAAAYSPQQCVDCPPGTGNCTECVLGEYQVLGGQPHCEVVPPGYFSALPVAPTPCPPGQYQPYPGRTACLLCAMGTTSTGGATACTACPSSSRCTLSVGNVCGAGCGLNQYLDYVGGGTCRQCPAGKLNPLDACATDPDACWISFRRDFYLLRNGSIGQCLPGTEADSAFASCVPCRAGFFADEASGGCAACPAGRYAPDAGSRTCLMCPKGKSSPAAAQTCTACEPGSFAPAAGASSCQACPAGVISSSFESSQCVACPKNQVAPADGMAECNTTCNTEEGFYSLPGSSACSYCEGGTLANPNTTCQGCGLGAYLQTEERQCVQCPPGLVNLQSQSAESPEVCQPCASTTAYAADSRTCVEADPGFVSNGTNAVACPPGTYRSAPLVACTPCSRGYASARWGAEACGACRMGYYASEQGQVVCSACPPGHISVGYANVSCTPCPAGTFSSGGVVCLPCINNTYAPRNGSSACLPCLSPYYSHAGATACLTCPDWTTWDSRSRSCATCAAGSYMVSKPAYRCINCPVGRFLAWGGATSAAECKGCSVGTVALTTGATACSACQPGWTAANPSTCVGCPPGTFNADGGACVECASGTYIQTPMATACLVCAPGTYQNAEMGGSTCALCPPGTISDGSSGRSCLSCALWPGTFASRWGQTLCTPRRTLCPLYTYINVSRDPSTDNTCAECGLCPQDNLVVPAVPSLSVLSPNQSEAYLNQLCPGDTEAPLFKCILNAPVAGQFLSVMQESVGASPGSATATTMDPYSFQPCTDALYDERVVRWVAGPDIQTCYVGCLYGISAQGVLQYKTAFMRMTSYAEVPDGNVFLQRMLPYQQAVCLPCPTSTCALGRFRPDFGGGCGPPTGLAQYAEGAELQGCMGMCANRPSNADYIGGAPHAQTVCPWSCLLGWHLADNRSACLPCTGADPSQLCNSTHYALADECLPSDTSIDRCRYCAPVPFAASVGWANGTCRYRCFKGYFMSENATCRPCGEHDGGAHCPVGMFLNESRCHAEGTAPICMPCQTTALMFVSNGGLSSTGCRVSCPPGFHTVTRSTGVYSDDLHFPPVDDALCVQCRPTDTRSCNFTTPCFEGYFRNLSVPDAQPGSCAPCRLSSKCPAGTYALPCSGATVTDAPCVPCDPALLVHQTFVEYSSVGRTTTQGDCPRACLNNYVQRQDRPSECVPCRQEGECLMDGPQPPACAFMYAHWNATPGPAWWDAEHAPPYLRPHTAQPIQRAGVCWACPIGTATLRDSPDLCITLPGYSPSTSLPPSRLPIPSLPSDIYLAMRLPRMPVLRVSPRQRRRLMSTTTAVAPCPFGSYKATTGGGICFQCPDHASTVSEASVSLGACLCPYGHYLTRTNGPCKPCPPNTFSNVTVSVLSARPSKCLPCPPNTSTLGAEGAAACACALGFVSAGQSSCRPCPAGHYCPPCTTADSACEDRPVVCFQGSTSPEGSHHISNCTCLEGVLTSRPKNPSQPYCRTLPPGTRVDPATGQIACLPGWTPTSPDQPCTLCPPGRYAAVDAQGRLLMTPRAVCLPCPQNTYNPTDSAMGACTPCPPQHIAPVGSSSLQNCSCPSSMLPVKGGCVGCLPNQYAQDGLCKDCPPFSLAQAAAKSLSQCLCEPGYEMISQAGGGCTPCQQGFYSTHASNAACVPCPKGSTTAGVGATRLSACGEVPALCLPGFTWRLGVGCFLQ